MSSAQLQTALACPYCKVPYIPDSFSIYQKNVLGSLYHVQCLNCSHAVQGAFLFSEEGMSVIGMLTDFLEYDMILLKDRDPITIDDVLSYYSLMNPSLGEIKEENKGQ